MLTLSPADHACDTDNVMRTILRFGDGMAHDLDVIEVIDADSAAFGFLAAPGQPCSIMEG